MGTNTKRGPTSTSSGSAAFFLVEFSIICSPIINLHGRTTKLNLKIAKPNLPFYNWKWKDMINKWFALSVKFRRSEYLYIGWVTLVAQPPQQTWVNSSFNSLCWGLESNSLSNERMGRDPSRWFPVICNSLIVCTVCVRELRGMTYTIYDLKFHRWSTWRVCQPSNTRQRLSTRINEAQGRVGGSKIGQPGTYRYKSTCLRCSKYRQTSQFFNSAISFRTAGSCFVSTGKC